jgi:hypothetical protein
LQLCVLLIQVFSVKYAHENGCAWTHETCSAASLNGHLDCLKYAHENGCAWTIKTSFNASYNDHQDCLNYAHENGCAPAPPLYKPISLRQLCMTDVLYSYC